MQANPPDLELETLVHGEPDAIEQSEDLLAERLSQHPQWAELLLPFLASGHGSVIANTRRLLTLFGTDALLTIGRGFEADDPTARFEILGVLWAHLIGMPPHEREFWVESIASYLRPGLADLRVPDRGFADPERLEMEHEYRICDETYLFLNRLWDSQFDDSRFAVLDEEGRRDVVEQFDRRFNTLFGSPAVAARKAARSPNALAEITIVARFPDPYATPDTQEERDKATTGRWAPSLRDFLAVAAVDTPKPGEAIFEAATFLEMLSAILFTNPADPNKSSFRPRQSVKRVNIISHGNPGLIAMSGTVDKEGVVMLHTRGAGANDLSGAIDIAAVQTALDPTLLLGNGKPLAQSLRDRMSPDAEIYLLACHTGMGGSLPLIQDMQRLFKTRIRAFSKEIAYCPSLGTTHIIDRAFTAVGDCNSGSTRGYKHLTPDVTVGSSVSPKKPGTS
jgi:hypothetical protein